MFLPIYSCSWHWSTSVLVVKVTVAPIGKEMQTGSPIIILRRFSWCGSTIALVRYKGNCNVSSILPIRQAIAFSISWSNRVLFAIYESKLFMAPSSSILTWKLSPRSRVTSMTLCVIIFIETLFLLKTPDDQEMTSKMFLFATLDKFMQEKSQCHFKDLE